MNSIKDDIDGLSLANEIRLSRPKHKGSFLLVEGPDDKKIFLDFCDQQACMIFPSSGKENLLDALRILDREGFQGVLGFADQDFAEFIGFPTVKGKVVFTDENDVEMMLLCSDALDKVLREFGNQDKINSLTSSQDKSVSELIFGSASIIGYLRLLSQINKWSLSFERMTYKYTANNSFIIDEKSIVRHVIGKSDTTPNMTESDIVDKIRNRASDVESLKSLCCGHDCIRILGRALKYKLGNNPAFINKKGAKVLGGILRTAYSFKFFQQTKAYTEIRKWEETSGFKIFPCST